VLSRVYSDVSEKLESQSVARFMFQSNCLTLRDLESIQSRRREPVSAAKQLLDIVMKRSNNVYKCFMKALKKSRQQHVEMIITGSYKGN